MVRSSVVTSLPRARSRLGLVAFVAFVATAGAPRHAAADEPAPSPSSAEGDAAAKAREEARLHFAAGVNLLQDPDKPRYEEAYTEFKRAFELARSPTILGNIALCAMKLERDAEAIEAYTRYLAEVKDLDPAERSQAERDLVTLKAGLARITVESRPDGALVQDTRIPARGEAITNLYGPLQGPTELALRRGHHVLRARFPDGVESTWEADIDGGEHHAFERPVDRLPPVTVTKETPEQVPATRPVPRSVYVGGIATGVLATGTIVTGILAVSTRSEFDGANDGTQPDRASDLRSTGQTLNVASDVLLGATVVAAAVTTYLYLARPSVPASARTARSLPYAFGRTTF